MLVVATCRHVHFAIFALIHVLLLSLSIAKDRPLEGVTLQCCTLVESPMVYEDPSGKHIHDFAGIAIDYLTLLENRLGFRCESLKRFKANNPKNQGFTGFVYEMEECTQNGTVILSPKCQCQMGVGGWTVSEDRLKRVDFPRSYFEDDFRILTHVDEIDFFSASGAFFLTAFSATTWIAVFGLLLCFVFLKIFDRTFLAPDPQLLSLPSDASRYARFTHYLANTRLPERLTKATKNTLLGFIGQSTDDIQGNSQTLRQWCITFMLLLCGLFLVLAYEATMTASLVQEVPQSEFRYVDDLKTCRIPPEDICIPAGGASLAFWEAAIANSPCHRGAPKPTVVASYDEGHAKVANKQCKYFLASGATTKDAAHGRYCGQVETTGEPFFPSGSSFVLPKGSNLTNFLSFATLRLCVFDAIDSIDQYLRRRGTCQMRSSVSLSFGRLKVFFILAYSACLFMFFVLLLFPQGSRKGQTSRELNVSKSSARPSKECEPSTDFERSLEEV